MIESVIDLVNHCYSTGLLQRSARIGLRAPAQSMMSLPFATAPTPTLPAQSQPATTRDDRIFDLEQELTQLFSADDAPAAVSPPEHQPTGTETLIYRGKRHVLATCLLILTMEALPCLSIAKEWTLLKHHGPRNPQRHPQSPCTSFGI
jgi:hypothetical protein